MIRKFRSHHRFMISYGRDLLTALRRPVFTFLTFMSGTLIILAAAAFHLAEHGANPKVSGFFDSVYFSVTTMTGVGFGDIVPVTLLGRTIAMFMMLWEVRRFSWHSPPYWRHCFWKWNRKPLIPSGPRERSSLSGYA